MRIAKRRINDLVSAEYNPRKLSPEQFEQIKSSLQRFGFVDPVIVNVHPDRQNIIVGGHQRVKVARELGMSEVPTVEVNLDAEQERELNVRLNRNTGEWDYEILGAEFDMDDLKDWGFTAEELAEIDPTPGDESDVDADPQVDRAAELQEQWKTERGQVWQLGDHRLMCGDSTAESDVSRLLDGAVPGMMVTDPPYGVEYDANWRNEADRANGKPYGARAVGKVTNDDVADWGDAWNLFPGDVVYSWHPAGAPSLVHAAALQDSGFPIRMQIIWAKNQFPIGRGDYHVKHEPCWYCVRKGATSKMTDDRSKHTLWEIDKPHKSETGHSTQKPVECMARPIRNHDFQEIYEPFCGSGTTIIACDQLGRKCFAMEIDPGYVAVTLQRYMDATGKEPVKL